MVVHFLEDALDSLRSQTCKDFEVLVSDDGSTDDSLFLLERFIQRVSFPVRLFKNSGLGISGNCNFLANEASGKFLKFLFQDDLLDPSCIEIFLKETKMIPFPRILGSKNSFRFSRFDGVPANFHRLSGFAQALEQAGKDSGWEAAPRGSEAS